MGSDVLQEAEVIVATKSECIAAMSSGDSSPITDDMICAIGNGTDACQVKQPQLSYAIKTLLVLGFGCLSISHYGISELAKVPPISGSDKLKS